MTTLAMPAIDQRQVARPKTQRRRTGNLWPNSSAATLLALQRSAGNAAVARQLGGRGTAKSHRDVLELQRCGPTPCDCSEEEQAHYAAEHPDEQPTVEGAKSSDAEEASVQPEDASVQRCGTEEDAAESVPLQRLAKAPVHVPVQRATAGDVPELKFEPAINKPPCACIAFIHNDERKARATARLLHTNCRYNLVTVQDPEARKARGISVPKQGDQDPNSLFPADIIESCMSDEAACRRFLIDKRGSTKKEEILGFAQRQYFLAIKDCSNNFTLPVVGLHNNALDDTAAYRAKKDRKGVGDLKLDVDKREKATGADVLDTMRKLIKDKFGAAGERETLDTPKTTNIYRWCKSNDIERCHVGDPDHPDNVTWVTNPEDFDTLKKTNVNVVFESQKPKPADSESSGDLSTMFVLLALRLADQWEQQLRIFGTAAQARMLDEISSRIRELTGGEPKDAAAMAKQNKVMLDAFVKMTQLGEEIRKLRFINIETEGKGWGKESERVANYRAIVSVLTSLGIHCCDVAGKGDTGVEAGLKGKDT